MTTPFYELLGQVVSALTAIVLSWIAHRYSRPTQIASHSQQPSSDESDPTEDAMSREDCR